MSRVQCTEAGFDTISDVKRALQIAVIESDDLVRELVETWLVDAGHKVEAVKPPLRNAAYDIIIADVARPRAAGSLVRSLLAGCNGPVLMLSARFRTGQGGSQLLAQQLGVGAVLPKPFTRQQLLDAVLQCLR